MVFDWCTHGLAQAYRGLRQFTRLTPVWGLEEVEEQYHLRWWPTQVFCRLEWGSSLTFREFYTCIRAAGGYAAFRFSSSSSFSFHFAMSLCGITRTG